MNKLICECDYSITCILCADDTLTVCKGCDEETREISSGDEGLTFCDNCEHIVEGSTYSTTKKEHVGIHYE